MTMFILTSLSGGKIRFNLDNLLYYQKHDGGSNIILTTNSIFVKETPEQIDELLEGSYVFIKKTHH